MLPSSILMRSIRMLSPFLFRAKVMIHDVWLTGLGWDEELPRNLAKKIDDWFEDLRHVNNV